MHRAPSRQRFQPHELLAQATSSTPGPCRNPPSFGQLSLSPAVIDGLCHLLQLPPADLLGVAFASFSFASLRLIPHLTSPHLTITPLRSCGTVCHLSSLHHASPLSPRSLSLPLLIHFLSSPTHSSVIVFPPRRAPSSATALALKATPFARARFCSQSLLCRCPPPRPTYLHHHALPFTATAIRLFVCARRRRRAIRYLLDTCLLPIL